MNKKIKVLWATSFMSVLLIIFASYIWTNFSKTESKKILAIYLQDPSNSNSYFLSDSKKFPTDGYILNLEKSTCVNGGTLSQNPLSKKISLRLSSNEMCSLYFDSELFDPIKASIAINNGQNPNGVKEGNPNFGTIATVDEGVYSMPDSYGTSYYYRGNVTNNYVRFAGFYWRIIRLNGDGSLRIIYDGTMPHENSEESDDRLALKSVAWNTTNYNDAKYVGYMYGGANGVASTSKNGAQLNETNANIKSQLENWYKSNIADKGYDKYVSDNIFCNDRSTASKPNTWWNSESTKLGYGNNATAYGAFSRFRTINNGWSESPNPKLTCTQKNDTFTKEDDTIGNSKLVEKVGLITIDEIAIAGGKGGTENKNYYLHKGSWYWSFSPYDVNLSGYAFVFIVHNTGDLYNFHVNNAGGVAPVINLSAEYVRTMNGNGTKTNPFEIK